MRPAQRDKDWPMIRRLIEADVARAPSRIPAVRCRIWLQECRSYELLRDLGHQHPEVARRVRRPALRAALAGDLMTRIMAGWSVVAITSEVLASGRSGFPKEPVRTLNAIHLGALLVTRTPAPDLQVLSLDDRVRDNARLLGFTVLLP